MEFINIHMYEAGWTFIPTINSAPTNSIVSCFEQGISIEDIEIKCKRLFNIVNSVWDDEPGHYNYFVLDRTDNMDYIILNLWK